MQQATIPLNAWKCIKILEKKSCSPSPISPSPSLNAVDLFLMIKQL